MANASRGPVHGAFIQRGLQSKKLLELSALAAASSDEKLSLVRNVFGDFQKAAVKGGLHISQNLVLYLDGAGSYNGFDYSSDIHRAMSRQQGIGIYSHVVAVRDALQRFIKDGSCKHAIASRLYCSTYTVSGIMSPYNCITV